MKNILKNSVAISIAFTIANTQLVANTSHCSTNENVVFSCSTGKKVVSVCASKNINSKSGYMQYRFGKLGSPEALIPLKPENFRSFVSAWEINTGKNFIYGLNFKNGDISYNLEMGNGTLGIFNKDKEIASLTCKQDNSLIDNYNSGKVDFRKMGLKVEN